MGGKIKGGGSKKKGNNTHNGGNNNSKRNRGHGNYNQMDDENDYYEVTKTSNYHGHGKNGGRKNGKGDSIRIYGNTADDFNLRNLVESDGNRTIIEMSADGNCLFRSLSDQLNRDMGGSHAEIRSDVCDYLEGHEDDFSVFLVLPDEDENGQAPKNFTDEEDAADFKSYVENMRLDGEWGGNLELVAASRLYRRNITVFSATLAAFTIEHGSGKKSLGPDLLLSYHDNDHYNSVRDKTHPARPASPIKTYVKSQTIVLTAKDVVETDWDASRFDKRGRRDSKEEVELVLTETPLSEDAEDDAEEAKQISSKKKTIKKNSPCPCGSGYRYKKCCWAKEKHAARLMKLKRVDEDEDRDVDDCPEHQVQDGFRVLKI